MIRHCVGIVSRKVSVEAGCVDVGRADVGIESTLNIHWPVYAQAGHGLRCIECVCAQYGRGSGDLGSQAHRLQCWQR